MKAVKVLGVLLPIALGGAAAFWTSLDFWFDMKEGLIAFLGFLAASLVQVMPLTANFLQADDLDPSDATRLTDALTKQQYYWLGLLVATIVAMVLVIVGSALSSRVDQVPLLFQHAWFLHVSWSSVVTFFIASSVSFVLIKMLGLFDGMMSLHKLRSELIVSVARKKAAGKAAQMFEDANLPESIVPQNYGSVIRPH